MRTSVRLIGLLGLILMFSAAHAGKKKKAAKKKDAGLAAFLGELKWGVGHDAVLDWLDKKLDAKYEKIVEETSDAIEVDRLWKKKKAEAKKLREAYLLFGGQRTGYETSIIGSEFAHHSGEGMLRVDTAESQNYYFFKNDRLWKVLVSYHSSLARKMTFKAFVNQIRAKHGDPKSLKKDEGGALKAATWVDGATQLSAEDRSEFYGAYVMKYVEKGEGVALDAARVKAGAPSAEDDGVDALMQGIMGGDEEDDDDVVDRLTGQAHDVHVKEKPQRALVRDHAPAKQKKKTQKKKKQAPQDPVPPSTDGIVY